MSGWPAVKYEDLPWNRSEDDLVLISKSQRRKIGSTYKAALLPKISGRSYAPSKEISERIADTRSRLARFDERQKTLPFRLPMLLLRSESAASSQIENLTSSARNIAFAELSPKAPKNARIIAGNISAMREALDIDGDISISSILHIHGELLSESDPDHAGRLREEQVWIGGSPFSPHGALYVPPASKRVSGYLEDLLDFANSDSVDPIIKVAIFHAQSESIHPFVDGNGRTGRAMLHKLLDREGLLVNTTAPLSAGLLHNIDGYMNALKLYQSGDPEPMIVQMISALDLAIVIGDLSSNKLAGVLNEWSDLITEREGSGIRDLPAVLVEQPVVDSMYVAKKLGVTRRSATSIINRACEYGVLRPMGNAKRGDFYQSDQLLDVIDDISSISGIKRLFGAAEA